MKKMMLSAAALLIGSIAMAQVADPATATNLSPSDNANAAEVTQGADGYDADYQKARVRQIGLRNSAVIGQDGTASSVEDGNSADVYQFGRENSAEIGQDGFNNRAAIAQVGTDNQFETGSSAIIEQGLLDDTSRDNVGVVNQLPGDGDNLGAQGNQAALTQNGDRNAAEINQSFDRNEAAVTQDGDDNIVNVDQVSNANLSDGMSATVSQTGNENISVVDQAPNESITGNTDSGRSVATTSQVGDGNQALQVQRSTALEGSVGETATINQGLDGGVTGAIAIQDQRGESNNATINQDDDGGYVAEEGDYAKQRQVDSYNVATATQSRDGAAADAAGNFSFQDQKGYSNVSTHTQTGGGNFAQGVQDGINNNLTTNQTGNDNRAHVTQIWANSVANTDQVGTANFAFVNQMEGESSAITQHGSHNKAAVFQTRTGYLPENQTDLIFGERYEFTPNTPTLDPVPHLTTSTSPYDN